MIIQDLSWAGQEIAYSVQRTADRKGTLEIPYAIGTIEERSIPKDAPSAVPGRTLFLIQDAHTNESAQRNISKILNYLIEKEKITTVFLEAGTGDDSLSDLRPLATAQKRKDVSDRFLRKGWIQGPDYLDLNSEKTFKLWGVEDRPLYFRGIGLYGTIRKDRESANAFLDRIQRALGTLKPRLFHRALLEFDGKRAAYLSASGGKGGPSLTEYFKTLSEAAHDKSISLLAYPNFLALEEVREKESRIDFKRAGLEQQKAFAELSAEGKTEFLDSFKDKDRLDRAGMDNARKLCDVYAVLKERSSAGDYPELFRYIDYLGSVQKIDHQALLTELAQIEGQIYEALTSTMDERTLLQISRAEEILRRLVNLQATSADIRNLHEDPASFDTVKIGGYLNRQFMELEGHYEDVIFLDERYEVALKNALEFYGLTEQRDEVFVKNITGELERRKETRAAFVVGGFHIEHLKKLLRAKNISYVSVLPRVLQETNTSKYEALLLSQAFPAQTSELPMTIKMPAKLWGVLPATQFIPAGADLTAKELLRYELVGDPGVIDHKTSAGLNLTAYTGARLSQGNDWNETIRKFIKNVEPSLHGFLSALEIATTWLEAHGSPDASRVQLYATAASKSEVAPPDFPGLLGKSIHPDKSVLILVNLVRFFSQMQRLRTLPYAESLFIGSFVPFIVRESHGYVFSLVRSFDLFGSKMVMDPEALLTAYEDALRKTAMLSEGRRQRAMAARYFLPEQGVILRSVAENAAGEFYESRAELKATQWIIERGLANVTSVDIYSDPIKLLQREIQTSLTVLARPFFESGSSLKNDPFNYGATTPLYALFFLLQGHLWVETAGARGIHGSTLDRIKRGETVPLDDLRKPAEDLMVPVSNTVDEVDRRIEGLFGARDERGSRLAEGKSKEQSVRSLVVNGGIIASLGIAAFFAGLLPFQADPWGVKFLKTLATFVIFSVFSDYLAKRSTGEKMSWKAAYKAGLYGVGDTGITMVFNYFAPLVMESAEFSIGPAADAFIRGFIQAFVLGPVRYRLKAKIFHTEDKAKKEGAIARRAYEATWLSRPYGTLANWPVQIMPEYFRSAAEAIKTQWFSHYSSYANHRHSRASLIDRPELVRRIQTIVRREWVALMVYGMIAPLLNLRDALTERTGKPGPERRIERGDSRVRGALRLVGLAALLLGGVWLTRWKPVNLDEVRKEPFDQTEQQPSLPNEYEAIFQSAQQYTLAGRLLDARRAYFAGFLMKGAELDFPSIAQETKDPATALRQMADYLDSVIPDNPTVLELPGIVRDARKISDLLRQAADLPIPPDPRGPFVEDMKATLKDMARVVLRTIPSAGRRSVARNTESAVIGARLASASWNWGRWVPGGMREKIQGFVEDGVRISGYSVDDARSLSVQYAGNADKGNPLVSILENDQKRIELMSYTDRVGRKYLYQAPAPDMTRNQKKDFMLRVLRARPKYKDFLKEIRKEWATKDNSKRNLAFRRLWAVYHQQLSTEYAWNLILKEERQLYAVKLTSLDGPVIHFDLLIHRDGRAAIRLQGDVWKMLRPEPLIQGEDPRSVLIRQAQHTVESEEVQYILRYEGYISRLNTAAAELRLERALFTKHSDRINAVIDEIRDGFSLARSPKNKTKYQVKKRILEKIDFAKSAVTQESTIEVAQRLNAVGAEIQAEIERLKVIVQRTQERKADLRKQGPDGSRLAEEIIVRPEDFDKFSSEKVAQEIRRLQEDPSKVVQIVFATGNTMVGFLDRLALAEDIDWSRVMFWHQDEYRGLTRAHEASFARYLIDNFLKKLPADNHIPDANVHLIADYLERYSSYPAYLRFFGGLVSGRNGGIGAYLRFVFRSTNNGPPGLFRRLVRFLSALGTTDYAGMYQYLRAIRQAGGIDIEIHGIGLDGHLAFAEPPYHSKKDGTMQLVRLDPSTIEHNVSDYPGIRDNPYAVSFGMSDILTARKIFQLINGRKKAEITKKAWRGPVTEEVPSSLLQEHPDVVLIIDTDAASEAPGGFIIAGRDGVRPAMGLNAEQERAKTLIDDAKDTHDAVVVLNVCLMNQHRSPTMHAILQDALEREGAGLSGKVTIRSGGMWWADMLSMQREYAVEDESALPKVEIPDGFIQAADEAGIDEDVIRSIRPSGVTADQVDNATVIVASEEWIRRLLLKHFPASAGKIFLFTDLAPGVFDSEAVPDPGQGQISYHELFVDIRRGFESFLLPWLQRRAVNAFPESASLSDDSIDRTSSIALELARYVHGGNFDALVFSGSSRMTTYGPFSAAWAGLYPDEDLPKTVFLDRRDNQLLYKNNFTTPDRKRRIFIKSGLDLPPDANILAVEDISHSGTKVIDMTSAYREAGYRNVRWAHFAAKSDSSIFSDPRSHSFVGSEDPVYFSEFTFFAIGASEGADGVRETVERVKVEITDKMLLHGSRLAAGSVGQQLRRFGSDIGVLIKSIQLQKDLSPHNRQRVSDLLDEFLQLSRSDAVRLIPSDLREELRSIHGAARGLLNYQTKDLGPHAAQLLGSAKRRLESLLSSDGFRLYEETVQKETDLGAAQELAKIGEALAQIGTDLGALKREYPNTRRAAVRSLLRNVREGMDHLEKFQELREYGYLDFVHRGLRRGFRRLEHSGAVFFSSRVEQSRLIRQMASIHKKLNAAHKRASRHLLVRNTVLYEKPAKGDRWTVPALSKKLRIDERTIRYDLKHLGLSEVSGAPVWKLERWVEARRDWVQNKLLNEDPPQPKGWTTADLAEELAREKVFPSTYGSQKRAQKAIYQDLEARDLLRSERLKIVEQKLRMSEQEVAARRELVKRTLFSEDPPQGKKWTVPMLAVRLALSRVTVYQDLKRQGLSDSERLDYKVITRPTNADLEIRRGWLKRAVEQWPAGEKPDTAILARAMMKRFPDRFGDDFRETQVVVRKDLMSLGLFDESKVRAEKRSSDGSRLAKTQPLNVTVNGEKKEVSNVPGTTLRQILENLGIEPEEVQSLTVLSLGKREETLLKADQTNIRTFLSISISSSQERIEIRTLAGSRLAKIKWQRKLPASKGKFYRPLNEHRHWEFFEDFYFPKYLMGSHFGSLGAFNRWEIGSLNGGLSWSVDFPDDQNGPSRVAVRWLTEKDGMQDMELFSLPHWAAKGISFDISRAVVAALPVRIDSKTFKMYILVQDDAYPYFEKDLGEQIRHDKFPSWEVIPVSQGLEITEEIEREVVHTPFSISNVLLEGANDDPSRAFPSSLRAYLDQKNYEVLEILHGGSATDVLLIRERTTGKKFVLKYSEWEGVSGNGVPWLLAQARYMKETSEKLRTDVFPRIFDIHNFEDGAALYVMEYFDGSQSVADRLMNERSSGQDVLNEIGQLIDFTAKELYEREPIEIRPALDMKRLHLNRMRDRLALVGERKGEVFHWLMRGRPVFFGKGASYRDFAKFYQDLMSKPTTRINGRIYPSLASLIQTLEERWPEVEKALGPGHYASYVHGDFSLRNALWSADGKYHFIDTRGMGIHESTPDRISIEYEVGKLVHSLLSDFLQRDAFEVSVEGDGTSIDIHASFKDGMPGAQAYIQAYRHIDDYLVHQETLRKLLGPETKGWDRQIRLAEAAHYVSNIIHRINEDPTGKHAVMYYVFSVATLTDFLSDLGLIESPARTSDLLSPTETSAKTGSRLAMDVEAEVKKAIEERWPEGKRPSFSSITRSDKLRVDLFNEDETWGGSIELQHIPQERQIVVNAFRLRPQWMNKGLATRIMEIAFNAFPDTNTLVWPQPSDSASGFVHSLERKGYLRNISHFIWRDRIRAQIVRSSKNFDTQPESHIIPNTDHVAVQNEPIRILQSDPIPKQYTFPNSKYLRGFRRSGNWAGSEAGRLAKHLSVLRPAVLEKISKGKVLLQGTGRNIDEILMLNMLFPGAEITAIDADMENLLWIKNELERKAGFDASKLTLYRADFSRMPVPDGDFNLIYSSNVYVNDFERFGLRDWLVEMRRVLDPDGVYLTSTSGRKYFSESGFQLIVLGDFFTERFLALQDMTLVSEGSTTPDAAIPWLHHVLGNGARMAGVSMRDAVDQLHSLVSEWRDSEQILLDLPDGEPYPMKITFDRYGLPIRIWSAWESPEERQSPWMRHDLLYHIQTGFLQPDGDLLYSDDLRARVLIQLYNQLYVKADAPKELRELEDSAGLADRVVRISGEGETRYLFFSAQRATDQFERRGQPLIQVHVYRIDGQDFSANLTLIDNRSVSSDARSFSKAVDRFVLESLRRYSGTGSRLATVQDIQQAVAHTLALVRRSAQIHLSVAPKGSLTFGKNRAWIFKRSEQDGVTHYDYVLKEGPQLSSKVRHSLLLNIALLTDVPVSLFSEQLDNVAGKFRLLEEDPVVWDERSRIPGFSYINLDRFLKQTENLTPLSKSEFGSRLAKQTAEPLREKLKALSSDVRGLNQTEAAQVLGADPSSVNRFPETVRRRHGIVVGKRGPKPVVSMLFDRYAEEVRDMNLAQATRTINDLESKSRQKPRYTITRSAVSFHFKNHPEELSERGLKKRAYLTGSRLAEMRVTVGDILAARSIGILVSKGQGVRLEDIHETLIGPRGVYYDVRRASDLYRLTNGLSPETSLTVFVKEDAFAVDMSYYKDHFAAILGTRRHIRTLFLRYSLGRHEQAALRAYLTDASLRGYAQKILLRDREEWEAEEILSEADQMSRSDDAPHRVVENSRIPELRQRIISLENKLETLKRRKAGSRSVDEAYRDIRDLKAEIRQQRREQKGARLAEFSEEEIALTLRGVILPQHAGNFSNESIAEAARKLAALPLKKGERVLVAGPSSQDYLPVLLHRMGMEVAMVDPMEPVPGFYPKEIPFVRDYSELGKEPFHHVFALGMFHDTFDINARANISTLRTLDPKSADSAWMERVVTSRFEHVLNNFISHMHDGGHLYLNDISRISMGMVSVEDESRVFYHLDRTIERMAGERGIKFELLPQDLDDFSLSEAHHDTENRSSRVYRVTKPGPRLAASVDESDSDADKNGSRLAEENRPETVSWLPQFKLMLVGLASILSLSIAQAMPLEVELGTEAAVVSVQRQGQEIVAGNVPGLGEVRTSRFSRSSPKVQGSGTSVSEIRMQNDSTNTQVHADLEAAGILSGRPVVVELGAQIFDGRSLEDFTRWFIEEVRAAKKRDPNAYFVWQGAGNPDKGVFLSNVPADLKDAARVKVFRPGVSQGARLGARSVPVEITEKSAPAFQALLETFIASGRIDTRNIPDGYANAYSTLSGSRLSTQTLSDILEDRADLATQKQYSLKVLLQNVAEYLRYANLRFRMLVQSA